MFANSAVVVPITGAFDETCDEDNAVVCHMSRFNFRSVLKPRPAIVGNASGKSLAIADKSMIRSSHKANTCIDDTGIL